MSSHTLLGYVGDHKTDRQHMLFCKIRYKQPQTTRPPAAPISSQLLILQSLFSPAMARYAYRRRLNNSPRRDAKYRKDKNVKYMHLGAGQVGVRQILQRCWSSHVVAATTSIFLVRYAVLIRQLLQYHQQPVNHALQQAISNLGGQAALYVHHVMQWQFMDSALYDIPLLEWLQAREFRQARANFQLRHLFAGRTGGPPIMATNYQYTDSHAKSEGRKVGRKILVLRAVLRPSALRHNKRSTQKTTEGRLRRNRRTTFASLTSVRHNGPCVAAKPPLISVIAKPSDSQ